MSVPRVPLEADQRCDCEVVPAAVRIDRQHLGHVLGFPPSIPGRLLEDDEAGTESSDIRTSRAHHKVCTKLDGRIAITVKLVEFAKR
jgi:hypothetical protein